MGSLAVLVGMGHVTYAHLSLSLPLGSFVPGQFDNFRPLQLPLAQVTTPDQSQ